MTQCRGLFGDEGKLEEKKPVWKIILILQSGNGSGKGGHGFKSYLEKKFDNLASDRILAGERRKKKDLEVNIIPKSPP